MDTENGRRTLRRVADRRAVLRNAAGLTVLPLGASLLSGCDDDSGNPSATSTTGDATTLASSRVSTATTSFTVAVLPNTQFHFALRHGGGEQPVLAQIWQRVPYSILAGNHRLIDRPFTA